MQYDGGPITLALQVKYFPALTPGENTEADQFTTSSNTTRYLPPF